MTAGTRTIEHHARQDAHATKRRFAPTFAAAAARAPRAFWQHLAVGAQIGPMPETELGRHMGARI